MGNYFRRMSAPMLIAGLLLPVGVAGFVAISLVGVQPNGSILLPNGQTIVPAGTQIEVNDRPLGIAVSPDGIEAAVATASNFAPRAVHIINLATRTVAQTLSVGNSFAGIAYSADGKTLYVGGGADNDVKVFTRGAGGVWTQAPHIPIVSSSPSGLSLSPAGDKLYVALNRLNALGIVDTIARTTVQVQTGAFPYSALATRDGRKVYVSNWGGRLPRAGDATDGSNPVVVDPATGIANNGTVSVYDTAAQAVAKTIEVGLHPSALALSPDGSRLYVANANSDSISVVDTARDAVESTIDMRPSKTARLGSAPNAIVVSQDGRTLYVANGGNNAIAVVEPGRRDPIKGFIPVGWFPAALALTNSGDQLLVGNGYGFGSIAPAADSTGRSYADRTGEISFLAVPIPTGQLKQYTVQVRRNNETIGAGPSPMSDPVAGAVPVPPEHGHASPIEHVVYIIKENRTYDQVFGDLPQGNGDPSLVMFGRT